MDSTAAEMPYQDIEHPPVFDSSKTGGRRMNKTFGQMINNTFQIESMLTP